MNAFMSAFSIIALGLAYGASGASNGAVAAAAADAGVTGWTSAAAGSTGASPSGSGAIIARCTLSVSRGNCPHVLIGCTPPPVNT